ncbi:uncharacterized protein PV07_12856 [Cladophialophora immunda]|uniref:Uncharacterized protein n=1 Tax=Cladophialophora immunda TaxID=569365 RepID=A0A0D1Z213_9EURO|nr:uncharacterized protein PV07_12856 [Cladophialophora immunda]KIW21711.1 hypothetical protein PV07_12856 [Cladophialophora immunda]
MRSRQAGLPEEARGEDGRQPAVACWRSGTERWRQRKKKQESRPSGPTCMHSCTIRRSVIRAPTVGLRTLREPHEPMPRLLDLVNYLAQHFLQQLGSCPGDDYPRHARRARLTSSTPPLSVRGVCPALRLRPSPRPRPVQLAHRRRSTYFHPQCVAPGTVESCCGPGTGKRNGLEPTVFGRRCNPRACGRNLGLDLGFRARSEGT